ncbi:MAG: cytochrome c [Halarcobacter sp.]
MKLLPSLIFTSILTLSLAHAQTTMCFKENHKSISTIETTSLNGGECQNQKSVQDMKKEGWSVADIDISKTENGSNYIYIFKKEELVLSSVNEKALEEKILQRLEERKTLELATKKKEVKMRMSKDGKKLYINKCQSCHGENANEIYGTSRALTELNFFDFKTTLRDYGLGEYDRGQAFVMLPYANLMDSRDVKNVYSYINSLKPKENQKDTQKEIIEEAK